MREARDVPTLNVWYLSFSYPCANMAVSNVPTNILMYY